MSKPYKGKVLKTLDIYYSNVSITRQFFDANGKLERIVLHQYVRCNYKRMGRIEKVESNLRMYRVSSTYIMQYDR